MRFCGLRILFFSCCFFVFDGQLSAGIKVLLCSTSEESSDALVPFLPSYDEAGLVTEAGFDVDYRTITDLFAGEIDLRQYKALWVAIDPTFLKGLKSYHAKQFMDLISGWAGNSGALTAFFMAPSVLGIPGGGTYLTDLICKHACSGVSSRESSIAVAPMLDCVRRFFTCPLPARGWGYPTTALRRLRGPSFEFHANEDRRIELFPSSGNFIDSQIGNTLPYAVCWNGTKGRSLIISDATLLTMSGFQESSRFFPAERKNQNLMHFAVMQTLKDMASKCRTNYISRAWHSLTTCCRKNKLPPAADYSHVRSFRSQGSSRRVEDDQKSVCDGGTPFITAYMNITPFLEDSGLRQAYESGRFNEIDDARVNLVRSIVKSKLSHLWIAFAPNMYYGGGKLGLKPKWAHKRDEFLDYVGKFTCELRKAWQKSNEKLPLPKILVGCELMNNVNLPPFPLTPATDLYGNKYKNIPQPLNLDFWEDQVIQPLRKFLNQWHEVSNGLEIGGVIFGLQMYCRQSDPEIYPSTIIQFGSTQEKFGKITLDSDDKFAEVFWEKTFKEGLVCIRSYQLRDLAENFGLLTSSKLGNVGLLGCYMPNIKDCWFYEAFLKGMSNTRGLSSMQRPVHLFTHISRFDVHKKMLDKRDINVIHHSCFVLSKASDSFDYEKHMKEMLEVNDGVWISRFSNFGFPFKPDWWDVEAQSPMDKVGCEKFFSVLSSLRQQSECSKKSSLESKKDK